MQVESTLLRLKPIPAKGELLLACNIIMEHLEAACQSIDENEMTRLMAEIINTCNGTKSRNFEWFGKLLLNHFDGIISHATCKLSTRSRP